MYNDHQEVRSMIKYQINVMEALAERGYTANRLRREKILSESTMQNIRRQKNITTETLNIICVILRMQPSDIFLVDPTDEEKIRFF